MWALWLWTWAATAVAGTGCVGGEADPALGRERLHYNHWVPTHSEDWGKVREMWVRVGPDQTVWKLQITGKFRPIEALPAGTAIEFRTRKGSLYTLELPEAEPLTDLVLQRIVLDLKVPDVLEDLLSAEPLKTLRIATDGLDWSYRFNPQAAGTVRRAFKCAIARRGSE